MAVRRVSTLGRTLVGGVALTAGVACGGSGPRAEPVVLDTPTGRLAGTVLVPAGRGPFPAAVLLSGSGPTDRDGNSLDGGQRGPRNDALRLLAGDLAERGVLTLRFDKRGIGESAAAGGAEADVRLGTFVDDASRWGRQLAADPRVQSVAFVGHSEGALIALGAAQVTNATAVVTLAGPGRPLDVVLLDQLRAQLPPDQVAAAGRVLGGLRAGREVWPLPAELPRDVAAALFRPSVQPFWTSLLAFDAPGAARALAQRGVPVTVVQGTHDLQVSVDDAERLAAAAGGRPRLFAGMNHVLRWSPAARPLNAATYALPLLPLAPGLADTVAAAVRRGAAWAPNPRAPNPRAPNPRAPNSSVPDRP